MVSSPEAPFPFQDTKYCDFPFGDNHTYIYHFSQREGTKSWVFVIVNQNPSGVLYDSLKYDLFYSLKNWFILASHTLLFSWFQWHAISISWSPNCVFLSVQPPKRLISHKTAPLLPPRYTVTEHASWASGHSHFRTLWRGHSGRGEETAGICFISVSRGHALTACLHCLRSCFLKRNNNSIYQKEEYVIISASTYIYLIRKPWGLWEGKCWQGTCPAWSRDILESVTEVLFVTMWRGLVSIAENSIYFHSQDVITQCYPQHLLKWYLHNVWPRIK